MAHVPDVNIECCLELLQVKVPTQNEIIDLLRKLGVFPAYRLVDQHGFVKLMMSLAQYSEQQKSISISATPKCGAGLGPPATPRLNQGLLWYNIATSCT